MKESEAKKLLPIGEACRRGLDIGLEKSSTTITEEVQNLMEGFQDRVWEMVAEEMNVPAEVLSRIKSDEATAAAFDRFWKAMQGR